MVGILKIRVYRVGLWEIWVCRVANMGDWSGYRGDIGINRGITIGI